MERPDPGGAPHRDDAPGDRRHLPGRRTGRCRAERSAYDGGRPVVGADHVGQLVETVVGHDDRDADPAGAQPPAVEGGATGGDRHRSDAVGTKVVDGRPVETGRFEADHRDVRLPGGGGREQVVDVDAALEHHDAWVVPEQPQRLGLPRRSRGDDQDDDPLGHVSPGGPR